MSDRPHGREEFRAAVDAGIAPRAARFDRDQAIPRDVLDHMGELGWWGAILPAEVGGSGLDMVTLGELHEEVGRGCSSVRSLLTVHSMVAYAVSRWGSEEQRTRWLPRLARGETIGAFCLTEREAGSDVATIAATAVRQDDGGFVLDGAKRWTTGGQIAGLLLVFARTGRGISAFLVERDTPGVEVRPVHDMLGTRGSMLAEIDFRDCRLGPEALLGPDGFALATVVTGVLDIGRYSVACGCVGILQACLEAGARFTAERGGRTQALSEHQLIRQMLTQMVTDVSAARLLCRQAGELKDRQDPQTIMATWIAKYFASTAAARAASDAVQIHGAVGCSPDHPVQRYYRDAKVMEIIEGSTQIQQIKIAEEAYRWTAR
ncbi:acyl-CoA dehydrogenase family protein [Streptomyces acidiscabies]|uniref:acyl-CoA dehydrogenase family protein n=1 Tax=Streptomyces acidiscabies TaxID=42234 RepID=UPI00073E4DBE|nr:acyl-CoA dehydrogenase family protein [Streptomyces acidiscabies]GAQ51133.1 acryloyl-CoA reductase (NADH [Streptomyces acidiscabies]